MHHRRLARFVSLGVLSLLGACAAGAEDGGLGSLSAAYSAGPVDPDEGESESEGEDSEGEPPPTTTGTEPPPGGDTTGSEDVGNPQCCAAHPTAGCDSQATESCVCASQPSCCQTVWAQGCVDLAIACGDPFCEDASGESTGEPVEPPPPAPPPEPPPEEPPPEEPPFPTCPCINAPGVDNFCHYGPSYAGCPMTAPGGYCDPNGDGSFVDGDWVQGWYDWHAQCA
jgi:hypothetical protein